jgi:dTDP-glucose 4,6-dehydratase
MKTNIKPFTIVVTGGLGFIGSRFIKYVYENTPHNIINVDAETYAADHSRIPEEISSDKQRYRFWKNNINNQIGLQADVHHAQYVVNFAAESHVDNSIADGTPFMKTNINGVFNLLENFKNAPYLRKFVQISTDEVYGDMEDYRNPSYATESFPLKPSSYYSASKASADLLVQSAARTYGIDYLITRSCNNFGPGQDPEKFLPKIAKCIGDGTPVPVYGDGEQIREWIHVDDNVEIIYNLMMTAPHDQVYNIGSGYTCPNNHIIKMIGRAMGKEVDFDYVEDRLGHDRRYSLNCSKLTSALLSGWRPKLFPDWIDDVYNTRDIVQARII